MKNDFICVTLALLSLGQLALGSVIPLPSIENPCQNDPTSTGAPQYLPISAQIQMTITAAQEADAKCQVLKNTLATALSSTEVQFLESAPTNVMTLHHTETTVASDNSTGLSTTEANLLDSGVTSSPTLQSGPTLSSANALTRLLRHTSLNITILYNIIEELVLNANLHSFEDPLRNVMSAMLAVKCRVTLTSEVTESNFITEESHTETELRLADYDTFMNIEEVMREQELPSDEKGSIYLGYSVARYMQIFMAILNDVLETEIQSADQN